MSRTINIVATLALAAAARHGTAFGAEHPAAPSPSAADLVREVYSREAWIRRVDSCLLHTAGVQYRPAHRQAGSSPTSAELEQLRRQREWQEEQRWTTEIAWDRTRVRSIQDYPASRSRLAAAWDGRLMTVHEKSARGGRESYGLYDDSRRDILLTRRVNLWEYGGLVTDDGNAWWRTADPEQARLSRFLRAEDFRLAGTATVGGRECQVVESRAGLLRLHIDAAERRVRRITHFGIPNDLDEGIRLAAMRKAAGVELASARDWGAWVKTLDPESRLAAERRLYEEHSPYLRVHSEIDPSDYAVTVPGGLLPRHFTAISSYPDWDVVERTGKYTYLVSRVDVEVTELKVNAPLGDELLTIAIPEGGKVFDWRFDPPFDYAFRKDRTAEELGTLAAEARRKRDQDTAPYREMVAQIEKRLGRPAPELPPATWLNGERRKLQSLRGKIVLLHFWATWCGPCKDEIRTLATLESSSTSALQIIGIHDAQADVDAVKEAIAKERIKYPICIDPKGDAADGVAQRSWYGIRGIPYTILIDREGRVAGHGALDDMLEKARAME